MSTEREQIVDLTKRLIEVPSFTDSKEETLKVLNIVGEYLGGNSNIVSKTFESKGIVSILWGSSDDLMNPKLLLSGHVDVASLEGNDKLLIPVIESDRLIGRGSGDMKGFVSSMVYAYKKYLDEDGKGVGLLLTGDEEKGGFNGTKYVIEQGLKPGVVFVPDGEKGYKIVEHQKAPHHFVIEAVSATGGGHAARAFEMDNPINRVLLVYEGMREKYDLATKEDDWKSSLSMTVINTDNKSKNKIPGQVRAAFSWRWPLKQHKFETGRKDMMRLCDKYGCKIVEEEGGGDGFDINRNDDYVQKWKLIYEKIVGQEVLFANMHGSTDGRHFINAEKYGTKKVLVTSAPTDGHHADNEWVSIKGLMNMAEACYQYQKDLTNGVE